MNLIDIFRKGSAVSDAIKAQDRAGLGVAIGGLLVTLAPLTGGFINAHPMLAPFVSPEFLGYVGGVVATLAGVFYHFGTSADRGLLPPKAEPDAGPPDPGSRA